MSKLIYYIYNNFVFTSSRFRAFFWSFFMKNVGAGTCILSGVKILTPRNIWLGKNVYINDNCYFSAQGGITVEDDCMIAPGVSIISSDHGHSLINQPYITQPHILKPVKIGKNVWLGKNCIILKGVMIGDNSIIAAGAVVTKSVPPNSVYGGNPAKCIKNL